MDEEEIEQKISENMFDINSPDQVTNERAKCLMNDCNVRKFLMELKVCTIRVNKKIKFTAETCTQEVVDLIEALDHCVKNKAFIRLK